MWAKKANKCKVEDKADKSDADFEEGLVALSKSSFETHAKLCANV